MINHDDVPYADPESLTEIIRECGCVRMECAAHGVGIRPLHGSEAPHPTPGHLDSPTRHLVDGLSDYGC
jgi:hypothetical protein